MSRGKQANQRCPIRYPSLVARLNGIRIASDQSLGSVSRSISYEFMNRQLVWSGVTVSLTGVPCCMDLNTSDKMPKSGIFDLLVTSATQSYQILVQSHQDVQV